jgi:uncharacterized GH25 family protein
MRFALVKLSLVLVATSATAHDFWLQPQQFRIRPGTALPITALIGHGDDRGRWEADASRVIMLKAIGPDGTADLRYSFRQRGAGSHFSPVFAKAGVYVVAMQTNHASSELPAKRFNDYAVGEGLTPILRHRMKMGTSAAAGRELYSRRAKVLIRVGDATGKTDPRTMKAIGLTLEIVPERDPYALGKSRNLPVRVYYEGKVLAGATVKLTDLNSDKKPVAIIKTNASGRASFRVPDSGSWLLNVVWSKPIKGRQDADFDTIFSSLTFGYDQQPKK